MRILLILILILGLYFNSFINVVFAQSSRSASAVDSYTLFWPLTAGKTEGDSLYFLKLFKEQIRGWLIFDDTARADYAVLLGTKRVLEVEKLLKDGKNNLVIKTLDKADSEFSSAYSRIKAVASKGKLSAGEIRRDRLLNLKSLIDQLKTTAPEEIRPGLDTAKDRIDSILRDYLP